MLAGINMAKHARYKTKHNLALRNGLMCAGFLGVFGGLGAMLYKQKLSSHSEPQDAIDTIFVLKNPYVDIKYLTDTLEKPGTALLVNKMGKITRNYVENNNLYRLDLALFVHEWWHSQNHALLYEYKYMTPHEYYKICMHNEITANLAALLTVRLEYMAADNKAEVLEKYERSYLKFYIDALKNKQINPFDYSEEAREKEWRLVANGVRDMWMKKFANHYAPSMRLYLQTYYNRFGNKIWQKRSNGNYQDLCNKMYTIGGVNFWKYMEKDIASDDDRVLIAEGLRKVKSLKAYGRQITAYVENDIELLNNVGLVKQSEAFQNLLIAARLKAQLDHVKPEKLQKYPGIITILYNKIKNEMCVDKKFDELVRSFPSLSNNRCLIKHDDAQYAQIIQQMYTYKGVDITNYIKDFSASDVPVKTIEITNRFEPEWFMPQPPAAFIVNEVNTSQNIPYLLPLYLDASPSAKQHHILPSPQVKHRLSKPQAITIPNWREPLLLMRSEEMQPVIALMSDYINMPKVLKLCNTEAQRQYWASVDSVGVNMTFAQKMAKQRKNSVYAH